MALHEEQRKLEREARSLALRLDAVLKDKFTPRTSFDADTPIDKTLKFLQEVIAVGLLSSVDSVSSMQAFESLPELLCQWNWWLSSSSAQQGSARLAQRSTAPNSAANQSTAQHSAAHSTCANSQSHSYSCTAWNAQHSIA